MGDSIAAMASPLARHWPLDPSIDFLNHGSFGACPTYVLDAQTQLRARLEGEPVRFMARELEGLLDEARAEVAAFVRCDPDDLAFVPNATTGVNTVLRSLRFAPDDELLTTDHAYNACANALRATGGRVTVAKIGFPVPSEDHVVEAILAAVTPKTRLALVDHITSPTGLVFPIERIVRGLAERGVDTLVDGAHGPGMVPLALDALGAAYYTGNCHKWVCAPKGAGILHVRRDRQAAIRPVVTSHGANSARTDRSRFRLELDWTGTDDPTAYLCVPEALRFMDGLFENGWLEVMSRNRALALAGRDILAAALGVKAPCPDSMIGSLASLPLPDGSTSEPPRSPLYDDPLQRSLYELERIEVPIAPWPAPPRRLIRISAQLYNSLDQYERLASRLRQV
jgi:isopenicillin-N epimerase